MNALTHFTSRLAVPLGTLAVTGCSSTSATATDLGADARTRVVDASKPNVDASKPGHDAKEPARSLACSPGQKLNPLDRGIDCSGGFCICRGYTPDAGTLVPLQGADQLTDVISMKLVEPMKAGQRYSFSVSLANTGYTGDVELWGANAECGAGLEKLYTEPFASKVYCAEVHPAGDYTYVLFVRQRTGLGSGSFSAQTFDDFVACPTGQCP